MTPAIEAAIDIKAPIADVFAAITDPRRSGEWNPHIVSVDDISDSPVKEGTSWKQTVMLAGRRVTLVCVVRRLAPPHHGVLEISGDQEGLLATSCTAENGITRLAQRLELPAPRGLKATLTLTLAGPLIRSEMGSSLTRLRDTLEREAVESAN